MPRASRSEIKGWHDGKVKIRVMAPPEAGRANEEVRRALAARLGVQVEMMSGETGRDKVFLARGLDIDQAAARLPR